MGQILGESPYSQYQVRFSVEWSLSVLRKALTQSWGVSKLDFGREEEPLNKRLSSETSLNSPIEWQAPLYINFVDFTKAFDSLDRSRLWKILRHYGIPSELVDLIRAIYAGSCCGVIDQDQLDLRPIRFRKSEIKKSVLSLRAF